MGVIKLQDAPKQIATRKGRGSIPLSPISDANKIPIGVNITATAALETKADNIKVTPYNTAKIIMGLTFSTPPISAPKT